MNVGIDVLERSADVMLEIRFHRGERCCATPALTSRTMNIDHLSYDLVIDTVQKSAIGAREYHSQAERRAHIS